MLSTICCYHSVLISRLTPGIEGAHDFLNRRSGVICKCSFPFLAYMPLLEYAFRGIKSFQASQGKTGQMTTEGSGFGIPLTDNVLVFAKLDNTQKVVRSVQ